MAYDSPPSDEEVLAKVRVHAAGIAPSALVNALLADGFRRDSVIAAIQRVFDRTSVVFTLDAKLIEAESEKVAA